MPLIGQEFNLVIEGRMLLNINGKELILSLIHISIIGAGNMGGAIARGIAQGTIIPASDVTVADPFSGSLETLQADYPEIDVYKRQPSCYLP